MSALRSVILLFVTTHHLGFCQDFSAIKRVQECFTREHTTLCLKEKALEVINETIFNEKPLNIYGMLDIIKDPKYQLHTTEGDLSTDLSQRSLQLNRMLYDKVEQFFESRSIKINLAHVFEGRGKKDKKGGMMMMGGLAMMGMMAQLFMGKIAFMAGAALLVAKMALMLSAIVGLKKMGGGGGGGETQHVVYTSGGDSGHSHGGGGGGWHRSLSAADDAQNMAYRSHVTDANFNTY